MTYSATRTTRSPPRSDARRRPYGSWPAGPAPTALLEILAPDVALYTDGGGKARAARRVVVGRDKVVRLLTSAAVRDDVAALTLRLGTVNGELAAMLYDGDRLYAVGFIDLDAEGLVRGIYGILNPEKLRHLTRSAS